MREVTPGEIQQYPEDAEIVMVASAPPIQATKARYYLDPRFTERLLPAPTPKPLDPKHRPKDDWTGHAPIVAEPSEKRPGGEGDASADLSGAPRSASGDPATDNAADRANAGIRREPELGKYEEVVPIRRPARANAFDFDEPEDDIARNRLRATLRATIRLSLFSRRRAKEAGGG